MTYKALVKFIKEARKRGYDDYQIRSPLLAKGWPADEIDNAFASLKPKISFKNKICIYLNSEVLSLLEKRAKKNKFTIAEQIEDILRRSVIKAKLTTSQKDKLDDMLVTLFSRRKK